MNRVRLLAGALALAAIVACEVGGGKQAGAATHAISGAVSGDRIDGVSVTLSGAASASTSTDANGRYEFNDLADGDYVVTPSSEDCAFSPASAELRVAGADRTADFVCSVEAAGAFVVEGEITGDVLAGINVTLTGDRSRQVVTGADGRFRFAGLPAGRYTVTAALGNWWLQGSGRVLDINYVNPEPIAIRCRIGFVQYLVAGGRGNVSRLVAGPDGAIWFTDLGTNSIGRIAMDGTITEYPLPQGSSAPFGIASGPDGALWYVDRTKHVGRATTGGILTQYPLFADPDAGGFVTANPTSIVSANDLLYFSAERQAFSDVEHDYPAKGYVGFSSTTGVCQDSGWNFTGFPMRLAKGPEGTIWFASSNGMIGKVTDAGVAEYLIWSQSDPPVHVAAGPDGNMWVTHENSGFLSKVSVQGALRAEYDVGGGRPLGNILVRRDGTMWVGEPTRGIVRVDAASGAVTARYTLIADSLNESWRPGEFVEGPDGALWCAAAGSLILRLTPP